MIEILNGDTNVTSYEPVYHNDLFNGQVRSSIGVSLQPRETQFSKDGKGQFCGIEGEWKELGGSFLEILIDIEKERDSKLTRPIFFGIVDLIDISEDQVSFVKNVSRDGKWRRYFYFRRKE